MVGLVEDGIWEMGYGIGVYEMCRLFLMVLVCACVVVCDFRGFGLLVLVFSGCCVVVLEW